MTSAAPDPARAGEDIVVRPYIPADRAKVRSICFVTGYMGDPVDWQWRDEESFADLFSLYYTDREPDSALVAEMDGKVVGYLLGCVDSERVGNPLAPLAPHVLRRGIMLRPGTARFIWRAVGDLGRDVVRRRLPIPAHDPRWPAHLHINLLPVARGRGCGASLVRRWLERLREMGVPGCHVETLAENARALAFFESQGFRRRGVERPVPGMRSPLGARHHVQLLVREIDA
jgi:ribosomal protein S18 acetylase RimI-like enzyme